MEINNHSKNFMTPVTFFEASVLNLSCCFAPAPPLIGKGDPSFSLPTELVSTMWPESRLVGLAAVQAFVCHVEPEKARLTGSECLSRGLQGQCSAELSVPVTCALPHGPRHPRATARSRPAALVLAALGGVCGRGDGGRRRQSPGARGWAPVGLPGLEASSASQW